MNNDLSNIYIVSVTTYIALTQTQTSDTILIHRLILALIFQK